MKLKLNMEAMVIKVLGYVAQALFVSASIAQARKSWTEGHSEGVSHGLIWMLTIGFSLMMTYVVKTIGFDPVLMLGYMGQTLFVLVTAKYKYFPRKQRNVVVINDKEIDVTDMEQQDIQDLAQKVFETGEPQMWVWDEGKGQYVDAKEKK